MQGVQRVRRCSELFPGSDTARFLMLQVPTRNPHRIEGFTPQSHNPIGLDLEQLNGALEIP